MCMHCGYCTYAVIQYDGINVRARVRLDMRLLAEVDTALDYVLKLCAEYDVYVTETQRVQDRAAADAHIKFLTRHLDMVLLPVLRRRNDNDVTQVYGETHVDYLRAYIDG